MAWTMPGTKPKSVNKILSQNAPRIPTVKKTPRGGSIIAKIICRIFMTFVFRLSNSNLEQNFPTLR